MRFAFTKESGFSSLKNEDPTIAIVWFTDWIGSIGRIAEVELDNIFLISLSLRTNFGPVQLS